MSIAARLLAALVAIATAAPLAASQAPVVNAAVERRTVAQGLATDIRAIAQRGGAAWIGYRVPLLRSTNERLAGAGCCNRCRLEPSTELVMLVRVDGGEIADIRPIAVDCDIDAAGMPLVWFETVDPDESVAWLAGLVRAAPSAPGRVERAALAAVSRHATPSAAPALIAIARDHPHRDVRRDAMLRLGASNDPRAIAFLAQLLVQ